MPLPSIDPMPTPCWTLLSRKRATVSRELLVLPLQTPVLPSTTVNHKPALAGWHYLNGCASRCRVKRLRTSCRWPLNCNHPARQTPSKLEKGLEKHDTQKNLPTMSWLLCNTHMYMCMYIYIGRYIHIHIYVYLFIFICISICRCICKCRSVYVYVRR